MTGHRYRPAIVVGLFWFGIYGAAQAASGPITKADTIAIKHYLRTREREIIDSSSRFFASHLPGSKLTIVYLEYGKACATGGCTLILLHSRAGALHEQGYFSVFRPITLLATFHFGQPDIGVQGRWDPTGKGWVRYQFPLRFNGRRYHELQKVHLANAGQPLKGQILIGKQDRGIPVY